MRSGAGSQRTQRFDSYVESVDTILRIPEVESALGGLATRILAVNAKAFLPNEKGGQLVIPRQYRGDYDRLAIVPMPRKEAAQASDKLAVITSDFSDWFPMEETVISPVSRYSIGRAALYQEMLDLGRRQHTNDGSDIEIAERSSQDLSAASWARTVVNLWPGENSQLPEARYIKRTRPVTVVESDGMDNASEWLRAAIVAHEEAHAVDALHNAALYASTRGGAASELAGYFVTDAIMQLSPFMGGDIAEGARDLEAWRQKELGPDNFVPNDEQVKYLQTIGAF